MENHEETVRRVNRHVAHRLKAQRLQQGITQMALGRELGVTFQQIQKYENGKSVLSAGRVYQLARALKVSPVYFFEGLGSREEAAIQAGREEWYRQATALAQIANPKVRKGIKELIQAAARMERTLRTDQER